MLTFVDTDAVEMLDRVYGEIGCPKMIRVDQCRKFISRDMDLRTYQKRITWDFLLPEVLTGNAFIEAFNSKFRKNASTPTGFYR
ncbi:MAG: hypothetical protein AAF409_13120 [Pseudomonadota bacterium]